MTMLRLSGNVELQAGAKGKRPTLKIRAYSGATMNVANFGPVAIELSGLAIQATTPILLSHSNDLDSLAAQGLAKVVNGSLIVDAVFVPGKAGDRLEELLAAGVSLQASVGVEPSRTSYVRKSGEVKANGQPVAEGVTIIHAGSLREVSILPVGADRSTSVSLAASAAGVGKMDFLTWCQSIGVHPEASTPEARERLDATYRQLHPPTDSPATTAELETILAGSAQPLLARAMTEAWTLPRAKTEALSFIRAARPQINSAARVSGAPSDGDVITAGMLMQTGVPSKFIADQFGDRVTDAASSRENRSLGIRGLFCRVIAAAGGHQPQGRLTDVSIRAAFEASAQLQATGYSTISLPGILGNVANKRMLAAFTAVPTTWQRFCKVGDNSDFKEATMYRLTGAGEFEEIPPAGDFHHITLSEASATSILATHGSLIVLTRQAIINDDLNAFSAIPAILGRQAAIKVEKSIYTKLLLNPSSFFASGNSNYATGGSSALSETSLGVAFTKFTQQQDSNGDPIMIAPAVLLTSPTDQIEARQLTRDTTVITGESVTRTNGNPWAGMFEPVSSPFLGTAAGLTGASNTGYYMLAPAGDYAIMCASFLNGQQSPTVESGTLDHTTLGFFTRAYLDFGVSMLEHRGGVFSTGA